VLFRIPLTLSSNPYDIVIAAVLVLLGLAFMSQFNNFLEILAFKFNDVNLFLMIKNDILSFISGSLIPLALLPAWLLSGLRWLPFYHVLYLPSMLMIGRNHEEGLFGLGVLVVWNLVFLIMNNRVYNWLRVRYDGVGI